MSEARLPPKWLPPFDEATRWRLQNAPRRLRSDGGPLWVGVFVNEQDLASALAEIERLTAALKAATRALQGEAP